MAYSVYPVAPVATAAAVAAVTHQWEAQKRHDEAHATDVLREAVQHALKQSVKKEQIHAHALPAAGGASGIAESLVEFAKAKEVDAVVVGSRGLGSIKRSLMSLVGLGSVSDYCIHQLHVPVLVVRGEGSSSTAPAAAEGSRNVVLTIDDSVHSSYALSWTLKHLLKPKDTLHCVTVALPVPYPILDETSAAIAALEAQQWQASSEASLEYATTLASKAAVVAKAAEVPDTHVVSAAVPPEGGASDVGASICKYAQACKADLVILGSRGLGSFKRSLMGFAGLGSVSDFAVHNCHCAVAVIKADVEKLPEAAPEIAAVRGSEGPKNMTDVVTAPAPAAGVAGTSAAAAKED